MSLRKATLLAIIGICYHFAIRAVGTFLPNVFRGLLVAQLTQMTLLLANLTILAFFIFFLKDFVQKEKLELKKATLSAIVGSGAMVLLHVNGLLLVALETYSSPPLLWPLEMTNYIGMLIPWGSSILILLFFIAFYKETVRGEKRRLKRPTLLAVMGSSISTLVLTLIFVNSLFSSRITHLAELSRKVPVVFIPLFFFTFFGVLYFFLSFYKEQENWLVP
jgi:hypothetical protein